MDGRVVDIHYDHVAFMLLNMPYMVGENTHRYYSTCLTVCVVMSLEYHTVGKFRGYLNFVNFVVGLKSGNLPLPNLYRSP